MRFKEKHAHQLRYALGSLALSLAMLVPTGCTEEKQQLNEKQPQGLLDPTPIKTHDKFNEKVTLYLVSVPVYTDSGERKQDQYMLTRGLKKSDYKAESEARYIRKAFFNGSDDPVYVRVDQNGAVCTSADNGFAGLFVDGDNKVVVVADASVDDFIKERLGRKYEGHGVALTNNADRISKVRTLIEQTDSIHKVNEADSVRVNNIITPTDSVSNMQKDNNVLHPDTVNISHCDGRE